MPFTFFAHQAVVLPLKLGRPRWFDGTALCIGSMAPDLAYAFEHTRLTFDSHSLLSQLTWSLPCTLALTWIFRRVIAEPLGLSVGGTWGSELLAIATARRALWITVSSALIGCGSHIFVDGFTHTGGWAEQRIPLLQRVLYEAFGHGVTAAKVFQYVGHILGTALGAAMLVWLMTKRRLSGGVVATIPATAALIPYAWLGVGVGLASACTVALTGGGGPVAFLRFAWGFGFALLYGCITLRRSSHHSQTQPRGPTLERATPDDSE